MDTFSRKIVLSLALTLAFCTAIGAIWLPRFLDQSKGNSIKELEAAPKINFTEEELAKAVTRFPTRAFDLQAKHSGPPTTDVEAGVEPIPSETGLGGLPTRTVPGVNERAPMGERVTTRAYLRPNASVFSRPNMTAQVLGTVAAETKVRWLAKAGEGWEEILLKSGDSAYVQSKNLSFSADSWSTHQSGFDRRPSNSTGGPDLAVLPATVENFLGNLSSSDLLRAETFLSPAAARLEDANLGSLAPYVGAPPNGRVLRIELIPGERDTLRRVLLVYGQDMEFQATTTWEWEGS